MPTTSITVSTMSEFYKVIDTQHATQSPGERRDIQCIKDKRRKGANTTLLFRYISLSFNYSLLPAEVYDLLLSRKYLTNLTKLKNLLDNLYPTIHRVSTIDEILADLA